MPPPVSPPVPPPPQGNKSDLREQRECSLQEGQDIGARGASQVQGRGWHEPTAVWQAHESRSPPLPDVTPFSSLSFSAAQREGLLFLETSALDGSNVEEAFKRVAQEARRPLGCRLVGGAAGCRLACQD